MRKAREFLLKFRRTWRAVSAAEAGRYRWMRKIEERRELRHFRILKGEHSDG